MRLGEDEWRDGLFVPESARADLCLQGKYSADIAALTGFDRARVGKWNRELILRTGESNFPDQ